MLLAWSAVIALAYRTIRGGTPRAALVIAGLVFSHFVLDFITHRPDSADHDERDDEGGARSLECANRHDHHRVADVRHRSPGIWTDSEGAGPRTWNRALGAGGSAGGDILRERVWPAAAKRHGDCRRRSRAVAVRRLGILGRSSSPTLVTVVFATCDPQPLVAPDDEPLAGALRRPRNHGRSHPLDRNRSRRRRRRRAHRAALDLGLSQDADDVRGVAGGASRQRPRGDEYAEDGPRQHRQDLSSRSRSAPASRFRPPAGSIGRMRPGSGRFCATRDGRQPSSSRESRPPRTARS